MPKNKSKNLYLKYKLTLNICTSIPNNRDCPLHRWSGKFRNGGKNLKISALSLLKYKAIKLSQEWRFFKDSIFNILQSTSEPTKIFGNINFQLNNIMKTSSTLSGKISIWKMFDPNWRISWKKPNTSRNLYQKKVHKIAIKLNLLTRIW